MSSADERVAANVAQWTLTNAEYTDEQAERTWRRDDLVWGVFGIPDQWIGDVDGLDVVELGCGTAFESARLARKGARVVGVDPTPAQLATARRMMELVGPAFPLVEAPAENVPLPDDSFDLAVSGYGASLWADPRGWLPEAARLLRPGGRLLFLTVSPLAHLCMPDTDDVPITNKLQRPQFAPWEVEWEGYQGVEFHLSHADWIRVLRDSGFVIDALHELQAPEGARRHEYYNVIAPTWARRWPGEDIWEVHLYERRLDGARKGAEVPALPAPERVNMNEVDSIAANIEEWTETNAQFTDANAKRAWDHEGILWGVFSIPEEQVGALPDVNGLDVVELGCGTAYFGSWLARRGARVTGVDPTPAQLATARRMMQETGLEFPLFQAPAEDVPLPDASFDLAVSEYGASLWADPYKWVPEASRLLRPGGLLVFLLNGTLVYLCAPPAEEETVGTTLLRDQFGMYRIRWDGATGIEYHLSHSDWIKVMRDNGFEIEALHELRPHPEAVDPTYYDYVTVEWAQKWPAEEIWVARKL